MEKGYLNKQLQLKRMKGRKGQCLVYIGNVGNHPRDSILENHSIVHNS